MVPDLARMSVIIKSQHETSVMTGNYEMGYACGLLCKLAGREVPQWETPVELKDRVAELLTGYEPANEREAACSGTKIENTSFPKKTNNNVQNVPKIPVIHSVVCHNQGMWCG